MSQPKKEFKKIKLTHQELQRVLDYNSKTGIFTWKVRVARCIFVGDRAGTPDSAGRMQITIHRKIYKAHRLAWFYEYGYFPPITEYIIFKDGDITNLKIDNLETIERKEAMARTDVWASNAKKQVRYV